MHFPKIPSLTFFLSIPTMALAMALASGATASSVELLTPR